MLRNGIGHELVHAWVAHGLGLGSGLGHGLGQGHG